MSKILTVSLLASIIAVFFLAPFASAYVDGIDVSHWQGSISWGSVYGGGYRFAFVKASQGTSMTDDKFVTNMNNAKAAGVLVGAYHFACPEYNAATGCYGTDAVSEAQHFVSVAGSYITSGYVRPALDLEAVPTMGKAELSNWVHTWMSTVQSLTGVEPIIYVNSNYAKTRLDSSVSQYDLWIAKWNYNPNSPPSQSDLGIWSSWAFWQYSNQGSVPGISGNVDLDLFNGDLNGLNNYVIGGSGGKNPGELCSSGSECNSGYCEGSAGYSSRCCGYAPNPDGWNGGGQTTTCGTDATSEYRDSYCDSSGYPGYQVTNTKNCDYLDDCSTFCNGQSVFYHYNYYVIPNSNQCTTDGSGLIEDCLTKPSVDSDGGNNPFVYGQLNDYTYCTDGYCTGPGYADYCESQTSLVERYTTGYDALNYFWGCSSFEVAASDAYGNDPSHTEACYAGTGASCTAGIFETYSENGGTDYCSGTCGNGFNSCMFVEFYPVDSSDYCPGTDTCTNTAYDADTNSNTCNTCKGSGYWGIGGDISACCGDDSSEYRNTRVCAGSACTSNSGDDACCDSTSDCVYNSNCYYNGYSGDVDGDSLNEQCSSGTWQGASLPAGSLCNSNSDCSSAHCEGSVSYSKRCCTYTSFPLPDGWFGGGNNAGCGADPSSEYQDSYCDSSGDGYFEVTNTKNCDSSDNCGTYCSGNNVFYNSDYYVTTNTNQCTNTGGIQEDCTQKTSNDTDGGNVPTVAGTLTDYNTCYYGACIGSDHYDNCSADWVWLTEYFPSSSSFSTQLWNCAQVGFNATDQYGDNPNYTETCYGGTDIACSGGYFWWMWASNYTDECDGTCGTGVNSCRFYEYYPKSLSVCTGLKNFCTSKIYDVDTSSNTCNTCKGANFWNLGGDVSNCCGDDINETKKTRVCNATACTSSSSDDGCCDKASDCVYNSVCYATNYTGNPDADGANETCVNATWQPAVLKKNPGELCGLDSECNSGYCEGSTSNPSRCCTSAPLNDSWYGGGNKAGCGVDPNSAFKDYYCTSSGSANYENTSIKNCDSSDSCANGCSGNNVIGALDFYVINNTNTCNSTGGSLIENCTLKLSIDSDGGNFPLTFGTVTDYSACSAGACTGPGYNDSCASGTSLTEYFNSSASYGSASHSCPSFEVNATDSYGDDPSHTETCTGGKSASCTSGKFNLIDGLNGTDKCEGTCGTGSNSCQFREYYPGDSSDACPGFDTCASKLYDSDTVKNTCDACKGAGYWSIGGETAATACCGDDSSELKKTRVCAAGVCTSNSSDDACCASANKCVYGSACYAENYTSDVDSDSLNEKCVNGTWQNSTLSPGSLCSSDSDCSSGYCEGSFSYPKRCCSSQPTLDGWLGGGNTAGCGSDPSSFYWDYYCDYTGAVKSESTNMTSCDSLDKCGNYCNGTSVYNGLDYFVQANSSICLNSGSVLADNCTAKLSIDSDGGNFPLVFGKVTDYNACSAGVCTGPVYNDSCTTTTALTEYFNVTAAFGSAPYGCSSFEVAAVDSDAADYPTYNSSYFGTCAAGKGASCSAGAFLKTNNANGTDYCAGTCGTGNDSCVFVEYYAKDSNDACPGLDSCAAKNYSLDYSATACYACAGFPNWVIGGEVANTSCCGDDKNEFRNTMVCSSGCASNSEDDACCDSSTDCVADSHCYYSGYIGIVQAFGKMLKCNGGAWSFYNGTPILLTPADETNFIFQNLNFSWKPAAGSTPSAYWMKIYRNGQPFNNYNTDSEKGIFMGNKTFFYVPESVMETAVPDGNWEWRIGAEYGPYFSNIDWTFKWDFHKFVGATLVKPSDGAYVAANELFDWQDVAGAKRYAVKITGLPSGTFYWNVNSNVSMMVLSPQLYDPLKPNVNYTWAVVGTSLLTTNQTILAKLSYGTSRSFKKG